MRKWFIKLIQYFCLHHWQTELLKGGYYRYYCVKCGKNGKKVKWKN